MAYRDFPFSHSANKEKRKMRRVIVAICSYYIYALQFFFCRNTYLPNRHVIIMNTYSILHYYNVVFNLFLVIFN